MLQYSQYGSRSQYGAGYRLLIPRGCAPTVPNPVVWHPLSDTPTVWHPHCLAPHCLSCSLQPGDEEILSWLRSNHPSKSLLLAVNKCENVAKVGWRLWRQRAGGVGCSGGGTWQARAGSWGFCRNDIRWLGVIDTAWESVLAPGRHCAR